MRGLSPGRMGDAEGQGGKILKQSEIVRETERVMRGGGGLARLGG